MEKEDIEELEEYHDQLFDFLDSRGAKKTSFCDYLCSIFEDQGYLCILHL